jgi:hypothetical protein
MATGTGWGAEIWGTSAGLAFPDIAECGSHLEAGRTVPKRPIVIERVFGAGSDAAVTPRIPAPPFAAIRLDIGRHPA